MPRTKRANTPARKRQWDHVEKSMLARGATPAEAVKAANEVLKKHPTNKKK